MRLGISSYTYVWSIGVPGYEQPDPPFTVWNLLKKAIDLKVNVVQIADNLPLSVLSATERRRFARNANESGISIEVGMADIEPDALRGGLDLASEFGSPILRVLLDTKSREPNVDEVVAAISRVAPSFERAGVVLAIENHDRFPASDLRQIIERIDNRSVGICFDTANSIGCLESAEHVLQILGPSIVNVHLKDFCVFRPPHLKGFVVEGRAAGQGQLDITSLLSRIKKVSGESNVILELWPPPQETLADTIALEDRWAKESIRYLRQHILA